MLVSAWSSNDSPGERVGVDVAVGVDVGEAVFVAVGVLVNVGVEVLVLVGLIVGVAVRVGVRVVVDVCKEVRVIEGWRVDVGPVGVDFRGEREHARLRVPNNKYNRVKIFRECNMRCI